MNKKEIKDHLAEVEARFAGLSSTVNIEDIRALAEQATASLTANLDAIITTLQEAKMELETEFAEIVAILEQIRQKLDEPDPNPPPAFDPGMIGYGAKITVPTTVATFTNLNSKGSGSLRDLVEDRPEPMVIKAAAGLKGYIDLDSALKFKHPGKWVEIEGGPIATRRHRIDVTASNTAIIGLHAFIGVPPGPQPQAAEPLSIVANNESIRNLYFRKLYLAYGFDAAADLYVPKPKREDIIIEDVTFQECIFAHTFANAGHPDGEHSRGLLLSTANRVTLAWCIIAGMTTRVPFLTGESKRFPANLEMVGCILAGNWDGIMLGGNGWVSDTAVTIADTAWIDGQTTLRRPHIRVAQSYDKESQFPPMALYLEQNGFAGNNPEDIPSVFPDQAGVVRWRNNPPPSRIFASRPIARSDAPPPFLGLDRAVAYTRGHAGPSGPYKYLMSGMIGSRRAKIVSHQDEAGGWLPLD